MNECRICLTGDEIENMISPCDCNGTNKYVHRRCLERWREIGQRRDASSRCPNCRQTYSFEQPSWSEWLKDQCKSALSCLYGINGLIVFSVFVTDILLIPKLASIFSSTPENSIEIYNTTNSHEIIIFDLGHSLATLCVIFPISFFCLLWESISMNDCNLCFYRCNGRFLAHLVLLVLSANYIFGVSFLHAVFLAKWFESLPDNAKWCLKPTRRRILDLEDN